MIILSNIVQPYIYSLADCIRTFFLSFCHFFLSVFYNMNSSADGFNSFVKTIYLFLDGKLKNNVPCILLTCVFAATILVSLASSMTQTMSSFRITPLTCSSPACSNDPVLCPGTMMCEPVPAPAFAVVDAACIYIFTIEYCVKLLTAWALSPKELDIAPSSQEGTNDPPPVYPVWEHYIRYIFAFTNLVDFLTILPYYITLGTGGDAKGAAFLRVFRLLRFFRLMNNIKEAQIMLNLVTTTVKESVLALCILVALVLLAMVFYGSLIFMVEQGNFVVNENFPTGQFIRITSNGAYHEPSPFNSIPTSFYWVLTTLSTVGYGDLYPTSWIGRMIANIVMMTGLVTLALPIGVIGTKFYELYQELIEAQWLTAEEKLHISGMDETAINDLFNSIDYKHQGFIDEVELLTALRKSGMQVSERFVGKMLRYADYDKSGAIERDEFVQLCKILQLQHKNVGHPDIVHPELALDLLTHQLSKKSSKRPKSAKTTKVSNPPKPVPESPSAQSQLPPKTPPSVVEGTVVAPVTKGGLFDILSMFSTSPVAVLQQQQAQADLSSETTSVNSQESKIISNPEVEMLRRKVNVLKRRIEYMCNELQTLANKQ